MQNEYGQGVSHATGDSKEPQKAQEKFPQGFEESLPNKVRLQPHWRTLLKVILTLSSSMTPGTTLAVRPTLRTEVPHPRFP
jgi:hypothetical protein